MTFPVILRIKFKLPPKVEQFYIIWPFLSFCSGHPTSTLSSSWWSAKHHAFKDAISDHLTKNSHQPAIHSVSISSCLFFFITVVTAAAAAKSLQSCLTLCDPIDGLLPGSPIPGILQARILEWVAISFSNAGKWKVKVKSLSRVRLLATSWTAAHQAPPSVGFSRQEYWSGVPLPYPSWSLVSS